MAEINVDNPYLKVARVLRRFECSLNRRRSADVEESVCLRERERERERERKEKEKGEKAIPSRK